MSITVRRSGTIPTTLWDSAASRELGRLAADLIKERTALGRGDQDQAHKPYSTNPMKLYHRMTRRLSQGVRRPKPTGGVPFNWVRGPRKVDGTYDETKIGQEGGRFYAGGYAQYKKGARLGLVTQERSGGRMVGTEVDLMLSGQMLRQFGVIRHTRLSVVIGLKGQAREYGPFVDQARPWIGISPANAKEMDADMPRLIAGAQRRAGTSNGAR